MTRIILYKCMGCNGQVSKVYQINGQDFCHQCAMSKGWKGGLFS